ncbi:MULTISPECIES: hypothetical protein [Corallincola]|uniref:DUF4340 domain-containing protein n=2 Tax=Corallincola TaxID=1775176 RepID=A0ABY1WMX9_9GAMM|nr:MULTISPECIES: hypothetical protein [Corallincola]TAA43781.1 hypothetical protein EXY25_14675 [Corallincola spongiicola]TCI03028.1 hypothetical protein EZV61_12175 [Corallincola luteus]
MKRMALMGWSLGVALLMGAILLVIDNDEVPEKKRFLPALQYGSEKLVTVEVVNPANDSVIYAERVENGWVDKHSGRTIEIMPLANLVQQLAHAKVIAAETSLPRNYESLDMLPPGEGKGSAWRVSLKSAGGYEKDILLGALDSQRGGQFVRMADDASVYVLDRVIGLPEQASTWLK